jgi:hypothetical protein
LPIPIEQTDVILREDFSDPQTGWILWEAEYQDGEMVLRSEEDGHPIWGGGTALAYPALTFDDFVLEVDCHWSGGAVGGQFGVLLRVSGDASPSHWWKNNFYSFTMTNNGRYKVSKWRDGEKITLLEGSSDAINTVGDVNSIHVETNGPSMRIFVNNQFLGNVSDAGYVSGDIAVTAQKPQGTEFFEARCDNVIVGRHPPLGQ